MDEKISKRPEVLIGRLFVHYIIKKSTLIVFLFFSLKGSFYGTSAHKLIFFFAETWFTPLHFFVLMVFLLFFFFWIIGKKAIESFRCQDVDTRCHFLNHTEAGQETNCQTTSSLFNVLTSQTPWSRSFTMSSRLARSWFWPRVRQKEFSLSDFKWLLTICVSGGQGHFECAVQWGWWWWTQRLWLEPLLPPVKVLVLWMCLWVRLSYELLQNINSAGLSTLGSLQPPLFIATTEQVLVQ